MSLYVVRSEVSADQTILPEGDQTLLLRPLDDGPAVHLDHFETESAARAAGSDVYRLLAEVTGPWQGVPSHAVYAIWKVHDAAQVDHFLESRQQLFELRRRVLSHFVYDRVLQSLSQDRQFMVLGLYGDEESATRLCREHPDIQQFTRQHPASQYSAEDVSGLRCFRVASYPV